MLRGDMAWPILDEFWDPDDFNFESTVASLRGKLSNKVVLDAKMGKHKGKRYLMVSMLSFERNSRSCME